MIRRRTMLVGLGLSGCSSPEPRLYTLEARPGAVLLGAVQIVTLRSPLLPRYMERREVIRRDAAERMKAAENDWWSEPLVDMVRRILITNLAQRLPSSQVLGSDGIAGEAATIEIEVELQQFDSDAAGRAVLSGYVGIEARDQPRRLEKLAAEVAPLGATIGARVDAMSVALGQAADQIAAALVRQGGRQT